VDQLESCPRVRLASLPTPLEPLARLSREVGVNLLVKRDDLTGLAFGGNKTRKLEYVMADVAASGADTLLTWAGVQSNWCRQAAAAANRCGIRPVLLLFQRPSLPAAYDGNLLLDVLLNAEVHVIEIGGGIDFMELESIRPYVEAEVERQRAKGRRPYVAPIGGSLIEGDMKAPLGAIAYVQAFIELIEQADAQQVKVDHVVIATGSGSTQAGLVAAAHLLGRAVKVTGISVSEDHATMTRFVETIANATLREFGSSQAIPGEAVRVITDYLGKGYGILDDATVAALRLVARTEGLLLDPVYTGKAMAAVIDLAAHGYFATDETVVFIHTGGTPALFPYRAGLMGSGTA
jgi:D-cysteine desulfhydrase family pyridoxal phosphate-dependent enzyme